jgi:membrane-bound metal-dependent hydrolase YbcI (DUF457 family)
MALCCAHTAAGYLAYEMVRPAGVERPKLLAAAVLLANAADLDFVPGVLLGHPAVYHRGMTHTVLAAVVVAALVALVVRVAGRRDASWVGAGMWAGTAYGSHLLLDFFTTDAVPPAGARFLWPFSDAYYLAPLTPLPEIIIDPTGRAAFLRSIVAPHTAAIWASQVSLLVVTVVGVRALRAWQARPAWRDAEQP